MKSIIDELLMLRDLHSMCVLLVHHTKKGGSGHPQHIDQIRGAGVLGAAPDTILMIKRSETNELLRLIKPVKLRHYSDTLMKTRAISMDEHLWFLDRGVVNEKDHLASTDQGVKTDRQVHHGIKTQVLQIVLGARHTAMNGLLLNVEITKQYNTNRLSHEQISPKKMCTILEGIGFDLTEAGTGGQAIVISEMQIKELCDIHHCEYKVPTEEQSDQNEE